MGHAKKDAKGAAKQLFKQSKLREAKSGSDTVRLWENYREQAMLWRALAIFQMPATAIALFFALIMWKNSTVILDVPAKPLPGFYQAEEIPDEEFISHTIEFVNLISTYQPETARRQFKEAAKYLIEPVLSRFTSEMLRTELEAIENTRRTQVYFVDPTKTEIDRNSYGQTRVALVGTREKIVAGEKLPDIVTQYTVTLTTIPNNPLNPYGIAITNIETTSTESR